MGKTMSSISFFSLYLELIHKGKKIGSGTGFIYEPDGVDQNFLVTNYHVLTGRYADKPDTLLPGLEGSPDEIQFSALSRDNYKPANFKLHMLQEGKPISWLEHKDRAQGIDIAAIRIEPPQNVAVISQKKLGLVDNINFEVGTDLFIVGFPFGFTLGNFLPIWKRGTVASEPLFRPNGLSMFYIDSFVKPGMSGSPVFAVEIREVFNLKSEDAKLFKKVERGELSALDAIKQLDPNSFAKSQHRKYFQLVGIFSHVITYDNQDLNMGVVWQKKLIDEIFANPCYVKHPFLS